MRVAWGGLATSDQRPATGDRRRGACGRPATGAWGNGLRREPQCAWTRHSQPGNSWTGLMRLTLISLPLHNFITQLANKTRFNPFHSQQVEYFGGAGHANVADGALLLNKELRLLLLSMAQALR